MRHTASRILSALAVAFAFHCLAHAQVQRSPDLMMVKVSVHLENRTGDLLTVNVTIRNEDDKPMYVVTRPIRADGSPGPYISVDPNVPSRLILATRFYPLPSFEVFKYEASLHLDLLAPGSSYTEKLDVQMPLRTTEPPFSEQPGTRLIPHDSIRSLQVQIGVLPASDALSALVHRKASHDLFTGMEVSDSSRKDHSIYMDQQLFTSAPVPVDLKGQISQRMNTLLHGSGHVDPSKPQ